MKLQSVCDRIVGDNEGALSCSILDLDTGLALARTCGPGIDDAVAERDSHVALDVCRGRMMRQFAQSLADPRPIEGFVQEAQVTTGQSYLFISSVPDWPDVLVLLVTERNVSMGLGWMAVRQAVEHVAESRTGGAGSARHVDARDDLAAPEPPAPAADALTPPPALEPRPAEPITPVVPTLRPRADRQPAPPTISPRRERPDPAPQPAEQPEAPAPEERQPVAARIGPRGAFFRSRDSGN